MDNFKNPRLGPGWNYHPWIKALIYMVKRSGQSTLIQGILRPPEIFLNEIFFRPRNSMFSLRLSMDNAFYWSINSAMGR